MHTTYSSISFIDLILYKKRETFSYLFTILIFSIAFLLARYNFLTESNNKTDVNEFIAQFEYLPETDNTHKMPSAPEPKKVLTPKTQPKDELSREVVRKNISSTPKEEKLTKNAVEESSKKSSTHQSSPDNSNTSHASNTPTNSSSEVANKATPSNVANAVDVNANARYENTFRALVEKNKRYPNSREAKVSRPEGIVRIVVELNRSGGVLSASVLKSSGSNILDVEALRTVRTTEFPPFPTNVFIEESFHRFTVAMSYSIASQELVTSD